MENIEGKEITIPDSERVNHITRIIVRRVANLEPGITESEMEWLTNTRKAFKLASKIHEEKREPTQEEAEKLIKSGLPFEKTNKRDTFVYAELLDALKATFDMIDNTNAQKAAEKKFQGHEYVDLGTLANIEFFDFFVTVHQRLDLSDSDMHKLMYILFEENYLDEELQMRGEGSFPSGVIAAVNGYLKIVKKKKDWKFSAPPLELDKHHSVDLIATSPKGTIVRYYELKGNRNLKYVSVTDITNSNDLYNFINTLPDTEEGGRWRLAAERLHDFTSTQNGKPGNNIRHRASFVSAPSLIPDTF